MVPTDSLRPIRVARHPRTERPTFLGILRGEVYKISRQRDTWALAALLLAILLLPYIISMGSATTRLALQAEPRRALYVLMEGGLSTLRIFSGMLLIIVTVRLIGMEYSGGTIRVLLARGVGRVQLLVAQVAAALLCALAILILGLTVNVFMGLLTIAVLSSGLDPLNVIDAAFWSDTRLYIATVAISMVVTILMSAAVTVLTRSLAVGLAIAVSFFAVDNSAVEFFLIANHLTHADVWSLVTGDFLGPNLNVMPNTLLSLHAPPFEPLPPPLVPVTGVHTLAVVLVWALAFTASALYLTRWRDVLE